MNQGISFYFFVFVASAVLFFGCEDNAVIDPGETKTESLVLSVLIPGDNASANTFSSIHFEGDLELSEDFIGRLDNMVDHISRAIPAHALIKLERGGETVYERSVETGVESEADNIPFVSVVSAVITRFGNGLGYNVSNVNIPTAYKALAEDIWVSCCVVQGIGGYCWGYEGSSGYEGFIDMDAQTYGMLCS